VALIVAIDGPSGVGKSTTSKLVARALDIPHIDTGAMYRAIGLAALRNGVDLRDAERLEALASGTAIEFVPGDPPRVILNGEDVTHLIRTPEISMAASDVSAVSGVRRVLVSLQQQLGRRNGGVLEGRDIGTKVCPEVRARRRYEELVAKGQPADFDSVLADSLLRDEQDSTRADSPLMFDDTYQVVDTSDLTIAEVVDAIVGAVMSSRA
jgi:cytidylate kinase